jgi:hypothetical protein
MGGERSHESVPIVAHAAQHTIQMQNQQALDRFFIAFLSTNPNRNSQFAIRNSLNLRDSAIASLT